MRLEGKSLDSISQEDILTLIEAKEPEGKKLDYKQELPGKTDEEKKELLADVSSFANASGGYLIYGVEEARGSEGHATATPEKLSGMRMPEPGPTKTRLDNLIRDGVEPRIPGIRMHEINFADRGDVLIIHIPRSWAAPHRVTFRGHAHFYSRHVNGKYSMDVPELRAAFVRSETQAQRIRCFRDGRLASIVAGETPVPIVEMPVVVIHIVPFSLDEIYDLRRVVKDNAFTPSGRPGTYLMHHMHNFEGAVAYYPSGDGSPSPGYIQLFRNGTVESVDADALHALKTPDHLDGEYFEQETVSRLKTLLDVLGGMGVSTPLVIMLALMRVRGRFLKPASSRAEIMLKTGQLHFIEKPDLILPETILDSFEQEPRSAIRPLLDIVWNACGYEASPVQTVC